ncbi:lactonase family protein [Fulvivirga maritima]|uniref:lactonase family protein n=1 Tax=Fulvivirga maritima TaxID=2904247 RepID=UPI001F2F3CD8|nr:lactonase family protein [Fulvivirga maritima]UII26220.1 lactonase family protein [Fulvivirga maritima]
MLRSIIILSLLGVVSLSCQQSKSVKETGNEDSTAMIPESDKRLLFVGTYTEKEDHVDGKGEGIYVYTMDKSTGKLSQVSINRGIKNPSYLTVHSNGKYVYAVSETMGTDSLPQGDVYAYEFTSDSTLREINHVPSEGGAPCFISIDPSGNYALVANYADGVITLLSIDDEGALSEKMHVKHTGRGLTSRQESAHAHSVWPTKSGYVYAVDLGIDKIIPYRLDEGKDTLESTGRDTELQPGSGPRHLAFHPSKKIAYVVNELKGTVTSLDILDNGELRPFQTLSAVEDTTVTDAGSADIHITPNGRFLYVTNRGKFNNLAMFRVDQESGELALLGHQTTKGDGPRNFVIDPSGKFLLVANQNTNNVITYEIDDVTGELIDIGVESEIPTPVCLKFMP